MARIDRNEASPPVHVVATAITVDRASLFSLVFHQLPCRSHGELLNPVVPTVRRRALLCRAAARVAVHVRGLVSFDKLLGRVRLSVGKLLMPSPLLEEPPFTVSASPELCRAAIVAAVLRLLTDYPRGCAGSW